MMGMFDLDPWEVARKHYERESRIFMARIMRHFGVTQVELPQYIINAKDEFVVDHRLDNGSTFYRIKDQFEVPGVGTVSTVTPLVVIYEAEDPPAEVRVRYRANGVPLPPGATRYFVDPVSDRT